MHTIDQATVPAPPGDIDAARNATTVSLWTDRPPPQAGGFDLLARRSRDFGDLAVYGSAKGLCFSAYRPAWGGRVHLIDAWLAPKIVLNPRGWPIVSLSARAHHEHVDRLLDAAVLLEAAFDDAGEKPEAWSRTWAARCAASWAYGHIARPIRPWFVRAGVHLSQALNGQLSADEAAALAGLQIETEVILEEGALTLYATPGVRGGLVAVVHTPWESQSRARLVANFRAPVVPAASDEWPAFVETCLQTTAERLESLPCPEAVDAIAQSAPRTHRRSLAILHAALAQAEPSWLVADCPGSSDAAAPAYGGL